MELGTEEHNPSHHYCMFLPGLPLLAVQICSLCFSLLQVKNAEEEGAVGALMYLDPSEYKNVDSYAPFGHVSM